jgi:hypothetical protein
MVSRVLLLTQEPLPQAATAGTASFTAMAATPPSISTTLPDNWKLRRCQWRDARLPLQQRHTFTPPHDPGSPFVTQAYGISNAGQVTGIINISGAGYGFVYNNGSHTTLSAPGTRPMQEMHMPNPDQPTIASGASGETVRRLQRALRRTPNLGLTVDGVFGPEHRDRGERLPARCRASGRRRRRSTDMGCASERRPMPTLEEGSTGDAVRSLQQGAHQWCIWAMEHDPGPNRWLLRCPNQSIRRGISGLGKRAFRRRGR